MTQTLTPSTTSQSSVPDPTREKRPKSRDGNIRTPRWLYAVMAAGLVLVVIPFIWMVISSLKPEAEVRAIMLLLAASLARGASGVRPVVVETVIACLNRRVHPIVPELGSVGASGDLTPLAHVALCLIGEGEVWERT